LEKKLKTDPENKDILDLYVQALEAYGCFSTKQGQTEEAKLSFKKAYNLSVKLNGEIFENNIVLLNSLGAMYYDQKNLDYALFCFAKAESIGQHFPDMKKLSIVHVNLGNLFLEKGLLNRAEKICMEGLKNAKKHSCFKGKKEAEILLAKITIARKQKRQNGKKAAGKKAAGKKTAGKKTAEKKPAEKKPAEKKPAEKKPAEKKPAEK